MEYVLFDRIRNNNALARELVLLTKRMIKNEEEVNSLLKIIEKVVLDTSEEFSENDVVKQEEKLNEARDAFFLALRKQADQLRQSSEMGK